MLNRWFLNDGKTFLNNRLLRQQGRRQETPRRREKPGATPVRLGIPTTIDEKLPNPFPWKKMHQAFQVPKIKVLTCASSMQGSSTQGPCKVYVRISKAGNNGDHCPLAQKCHHTKMAFATLVLAKKSLPFWVCETPCFCQNCHPTVLRKVIVQKKQQKKPLESRQLTDQPRILQIPSSECVKEPLNVQTYTFDIQYVPAIWKVFVQLHCGWNATWCLITVTCHTLTDIAESIHHS